MLWPTLSCPLPVQIVIYGVDSELYILEMQVVRAATGITEHQSTGPACACMCQRWQSTALTGLFGADAGPAKGIVMGSWPNQVLLIAADCASARMHAHAGPCAPLPSALLPNAPPPPRIVLTSRSYQLGVVVDKSAGTCESLFPNSIVLATFLWNVKSSFCRICFCDPSSLIVDTVTCTSARRTKVIPVRSLGGRRSALHQAPTRDYALDADEGASDDAGARARMLQVSGDDVGLDIVFEVSIEIGKKAHI